MKPSHFTTPRSMSEGIWILNADPIEKPDSPYTPAYLIYCCIAVICIAIGVCYVI